MQALVRFLCSDGSSASSPLYEQFAYNLAAELYGTIKSSWIIEELLNLNGKLEKRNISPTYGWIERGWSPWK
jgi:hypothetical protein